MNMPLVERTDSTDQLGWIAVGNNNVIYYPCRICHPDETNQLPMSLFNNNIMTVQCLGLNVEHTGQIEQIPSSQFVGFDRVDQNQREFLLQNYLNSIPEIQNDPIQQKMEEYAIRTMWQKVQEREIQASWNTASSQRQALFSAAAVGMGGGNTSNSSPFATDEAAALALLSTASAFQQSPAPPPTQQRDFNVASDMFAVAAALKQQQQTQQNYDENLKNDFDENKDSVGRDEHGEEEIEKRYSLKAPAQGNKKDEDPLVEDEIEKEDPSQVTTRDDGDANGDNGKAPEEEENSAPHREENMEEETAKQNYNTQESPPSSDSQENDNGNGSPVAAAATDMTTGVKGNEHDNPAEESTKAAVVTLDVKGISVNSGTINNENEDMKELLVAETSPKLAENIESPASNEDAVKRVFVQSLTGETLSIDVENGELIKDIKAKIEEKEEILPEQRLVLLFEDHQLEDVNKLVDYGVGNDATLYLALEDSQLYVSAKTSYMDSADNAPVSMEAESEDAPQPVETSAKTDDPDSDPAATDMDSNAAVSMEAESENAPQPVETNETADHPGPAETDADGNAAISMAENVQDAQQPVETSATADYPDPADGNALVSSIETENVEDAPQPVETSATADHPDPVPAATEADGNAAVLIIETENVEGAPQPVETSATADHPDPGSSATDADVDGNAVVSTMETENVEDAPPPVETSATADLGPGPVKMDADGNAAISIEENVENAPQPVKTSGTADLGPGPVKMDADGNAAISMEENVEDAPQPVETSATADHPDPVPVAMNEGGNAAVSMETENVEDAPQPVETSATADHPGPVAADMDSDAVVSTMETENAEDAPQPVETSAKTDHPDTGPAATGTDADVDGNAVVSTMETENAEDAPQPVETSATADLGPDPTETDADGNAAISMEQNVEDAPQPVETSATVDLGPDPAETDADGNAAITVEENVEDAPQSVETSAAADLGPGPAATKADSNAAISMEENIEDAPQPVETSAKADYHDPVPVATNKDGNAAVSMETENVEDVQQPVETSAQTDYPDSGPATMNADDKAPLFREIDIPVKTGMTADHPNDIVPAPDEIEIFPDLHLPNHTAPVTKATTTGKDSSGTTPAANPTTEDPPVWKLQITKLIEETREKMQKMRRFVPSMSPEELEFVLKVWDILEQKIQKSGQQHDSKSAVAALSFFLGVNHRRLDVIMHGDVDKKYYTNQKTEVLEILRKLVENPEACDRFISKTDDILPKKTAQKRQREEDASSVQKNEDSDGAPPTETEPPSRRRKVASKASPVAKKRLATYKKPKPSSAKRKRRAKKEEGMSNEESYNENEGKEEEEEERKEDKEEATVKTSNATSVVSDIERAVGPGKTPKKPSDSITYSSDSSGSDDEDSTPKKPNRRKVEIPLKEKVRIGVKAMMEDIKAKQERNKRYKPHLSFEQLDFVLRCWNVLEKLERTEKLEVIVTDLAVELSLTHFKLTRFLFADKEQNLSEKQVEDIYQKLIPWLEKKETPLIKANLCFDVEEVDPLPNRI